MICNNHTLKNINLQKTTSKGILILKENPIFAPDLKTKLNGNK